MAECNDFATSNMLQCRPARLLALVYRDHSVTKPPTRGVYQFCSDFSTVEMWRLGPAHSSMDCTDAPPPINLSAPVGQHMSPPASLLLTHTSVAAGQHSLPQKPAEPGSPVSTPWPRVSLFLNDQCISECHLPPHRRIYPAEQGIRQRMRVAGADAGLMQPGLRPAWPGPP